MKALPIAAIAILASLSGMPASAQTVALLARPDPAGITVPDLTFVPAKTDISRFDRYFYFYKSGVSYERAFADLEQCRINSFFVQYNITPPRFVPLGEEAAFIPRGDVFAPSNVNPSETFETLPGAYSVGGVIGFAIVAVILAGEAEFRAIRTNRKCMAYKGYGRYGISRAIYKQIDSGTDSEKQARMARIASGPPPQAEAIEP